MLSKLKAEGFKLTAQRVDIIHALANDLCHPTAQELYERLKGNHRSISFATVYNTLSALEKVGGCAALSLTPGATRFDPNMQPHHHMVCDICGSTADVPRAKDEDVEPMPTGFEVRAVEKIYRGVCAPCRS